MYVNINYCICLLFQDAGNLRAVQPLIPSTSSAPPTCLRLRHIGTGHQRPHYRRSVGSAPLDNAAAVPLEDWISDPLCSVSPPPPSPADSNQQPTGGTSEPLRQPSPTTLPHHPQRQPFEYLGSPFCWPSPSPAADKYQGTAQASDPAAMTATTLWN